MLMVPGAEGSQSNTGAVGWAVGDYGTILRYAHAETQEGQASQWEQFDTGLPDARAMTLKGVDAVSPDDAWAVGTMLGKGVILRYKADPAGRSGGGKWQREAEDLTVPPLTAIAMTSAPSGVSGWVVGDHGVILRYESGHWSTYVR